MGLRAAAENWLYRGVAVIPVDWRTKKPALPSWKAYQTQLPTVYDLYTWFRDDSIRAYGVVCGWKGLTVLDFDDVAVHREWCKKAQQTGGTMARATSSYSVSTARGVHVYVSLQIPATVGKFAGGDVKKQGGYVVGPDSLHPSGCLYRGHMGRVVGAHCLEDVLPRELWVTEPPVILSKPTVNPLTPVGSVSPWEMLDRLPLGPDACKRVKAAVQAKDLLTTAIQDYKHGYGLTNCPLHDDAHPSLSVNLRTGDVKCLAGCTAGPKGDGWIDAIGLYQRLHQCDTRAAVRALADVYKVHA